MAEDQITIELNPRERRFYDRLRTQVRGAQPGANSGLSDLLLLLPDLTVLLIRLMRDDRVPVGAKLVAMLGVGYVVSPIDLMPGLLFGPLGAVDDLLVVTAALSRLVNEVHPDVVRAAWPGPGDALQVIQRVTNWSHDLVGTRVRRFLRAAFRLQVRQR